METSLDFASAWRRADDDWVHECVGRLSRLIVTGFLQIRLSDTVSVLLHICRPNQVSTSSGCRIASCDTCQEEKKNTRQAGSSACQRADFKILLLILKALNGSGPKYIWLFCRKLQAGPFKTFYFSFVMRFVGCFSIILRYSLSWSFPTLDKLCNN